MRKPLHNVLQLALIATLSLGSTLSFAQGQGRGNKEKKQVPAVALEHIKKNKQKLKVKDEDIADLELSSATESKKSGIKHLYIKQMHHGIEIHGAITNISMDNEGKVITLGNRLHSDVGEKVKNEQASLDAAAAVAAAARHLGVFLNEPLNVLESGSASNKEVLLSKGGISLEPIPAKLVYQPMGDGSLKLAWEVSIYELDALNWWNIRVDANTGEFLDKDNMVVHCQFENNGTGGKFLHDTHSHTATAPYLQDADMTPYAPMQGPVNQGKTPGLYEVYPMPVESPSHGGRKPVNGKVADKIASPDGWHTAGNTSYTITRGNNVYAYEDPDNTGYVGGAQDMYGYSPDGGTERVFKYPIDFSQEPVAYRDAAITNLFYWNNIIHDVWYKYGFDEESGNFQTSNLDRGGLGGDHVMAEAQDSRNISTTRNNANFATPADGGRPRMQMYLWSRPDQDQFQVVSPSSLTGTYASSGASFGPPLTPTPLTGKLVLAIDGANSEGCDPFLNPEAINGNIAVVYRGVCAFVQKVENAQAAGAIAVVVINNAAGLLTMGGLERPEAPITIPAVMITQDAGATIREAMDAGENITVSLKNDPNPDVDGDFDNGIIVHEYGHGISNRLTGGPDITSCLPTQVRVGTQILTTEQMGEGWSDWFGLMMTMKPGDTREKVRGIGTYAVGEPTDGLGIRPAPYSTSFSVNNYTYGATNNPALSAPHGVGFVFATALWEMTWDLIDKYGFDEDLYNGNGGNNMAMQLVIDGLKLQPCRPGFVDGRDAILLADQINYGGANQELIWNAFARRGLGFSADQGLSYYRFDQVEAFDLPQEFSLSASKVSTARSAEGMVSLQGDLVSSYPNPFSESTTIRFTAKESGQTSLKVFDITGREVATLFEGNAESGVTYSQNFKAANKQAGVYIYRLVNGSTAKSGTMLLVK
ncbi:T9SS C-terminal target domain-containing protein [Pontibacter diazotrophicus]|uniref:T9SS C-terminal target domain-containing protein n=1 Tax=Pontibacter diazotrophicus TaxID=1400979 RepID=A0A3D8L768_9BACT|nr:T9SS-dependent M36 family metallopeptidase [Pontibacter diazotrophicus]RDV13260.1 T9SS C-terminal target domain-containing protein [Pontibacter diazotrophicus]